MSPLLNRTTQAIIDLVVLSLALWVALFLRFDGRPPEWIALRVAILWPHVVGVQYLSLVLLGVHRFQWRFVGLRETTRIFAATGCAAAFLLMVRFVTGYYEPTFRWLEHVWLPIGVTLIDFAGAFVAIAGVRAFRRLVGERSDEKRRAAGLPRSSRTKTILIGAGQAGLLVAKELSLRPDLGLKPVGFLDDDPRKVGTVLHGLRVLGTTADLPAVCEEHRAEQALITIADAAGKEMRRIAEICRRNDVPAKVIPGIYEIVGGHVNLSRIRELEIEDLLGRAPVDLDQSALSEQLRGKIVMVTGAGGSIGSELCRQVCHFGPARLILLEQAENALFQIHRELGAAHPAQDIVPLVADICDERRVRWAFRTYRPDVVLHAAAHKHVPMMEWNPDEAVRNNVFGTVTLANAAHEQSVSMFVMISTDKAVNPTSVMGATKRVAEIYAQALARHSRTRFVTVRFGNVLGSAGSVIPIFEEQIARGGPVTVTHPDMKRYFMTIPEACQLVLQAGTMGSGGEIFILDMGEPVRIVDLARDMIELCGLVPGEDIEIQFTGLRPGEKLFEELSVGDENADKTRHSKIFVGRGRIHDLAQVGDYLEWLRKVLENGQPDQIPAALARLVTEYTSDRMNPPRETAPAVAIVTVPAASASAAASTGRRRSTGTALALPRTALARLGTEPN
ncbi:MAG TPA: nucleoside-diphosphate sugar epimerase/dehydratase [Kofleriaceae bacterium]|nr:nucleoside-diphosphate sugar epimerase/dehydratase [Kofleriaceae bacterium]